MSARSDRCFGTPSSATTLLLRGQACSDLFHAKSHCYGMTNRNDSTTEYVVNVDFYSHM